MIDFIEPDKTIFFGYVSYCKYGMFMGEWSCVKGFIVNFGSVFGELLYFVHFYEGYDSEMVIGVLGKECMDF